MLDVTVNGVAYPVPSGASDTNWAAAQVAFEQALAAGVSASVRRLNINTTAVGNVTTGEDNLITYPLPASTLSSNGMGVRIAAWGVTANNANAKTVKLYFGSTAVLTFALTASQVSTWRIEADVVRTGAATQVSNATLIQGGSIVGVDVENGTPSETLSGAVTIKCTGEGTSTDDIIQRGQAVLLLP